MKKLIIAIVTLFSVTNLYSQVSDICPLECGDSTVNWEPELTGVKFHNPYMRIRDDDYGCCLDECVDFFWKKYECQNDDKYALHIRKIYTNTHAYLPGSQEPCLTNNKLVYLNHLKGLLTFMLFNNTNPGLPSYWDFSTIPPTPPWINNITPTDFTVKVFQAYCWGLFPEEHNCSDVCPINENKQMVLEPCQEHNCPCCNFEYTFHYENSGTGLIEITGIIHNSVNLEYKCQSEDCCFACGVEEIDKWALHEKTTFRPIEIKCD